MKTPSFEIELGGCRQRPLNLFYGAVGPVRV